MIWKQKSGKIRKNCILNRIYDIEIKFQSVKGPQSNVIGLYDNIGCMSEAYGLSNSNSCVSNGRGKGPLSLFIPTKGTFKFHL